MAAERVEGVREAAFSYERSEGFVLYDSTATTIEQIVEELNRRTGYGATVKAGATVTTGATVKTEEGSN